MSGSPDGLELLEVGRVARAHGIRGELLLAFTTDLIEQRTSPGAILVIDGRDFVVESSRPHKQHHLVRLRGVASREEAESLRGKVILAEPLDEPDRVFVHEVIGRRLIDQHGVEHGLIRAVLDNPASDLMELADGRLVPFAFLRDLDGDLVRVEVPPGLLDE